MYKLSTMNNKVILDILGGDNAPGVTLDGATLALKKDPTLNLVLIGDESKIKAHFDRNSALIKRIEIIHTTTNIEMSEKPTDAIRQKPDSSIVLGMDALKSREDCVAFVSAGSTGAVLTGAFMKVGRIQGVSRPALSAMLPTIDKRGVLVLDLGANMDCKGINLAHFALMADVYMRERGIEKPRIALLSVGTEDEKGNELTHEAFAILKTLPINFVGNMEARDAFSGNYDIIVTDGFAGNVMLKTMEGTGKLFSKSLRRALSCPFLLPAKLMLAPRLLKMKKSLSEDATGGAVFLGIKKPVIKAHGSSNSIAVMNAVLLGARAGNMNLNEKIQSALAQMPQ